MALGRRELSSRADFDYARLVETTLLEIHDLLRRSGS
jgi:hypothetical protein